MAPPTVADLEQDNEELRRRLKEAEEALRALRAGEVDAVFVEGEREQVLTLETVDKPYRLLIEQMRQGAATLTPEGAILSCNDRFAGLLGLARARLLHQPIAELVMPESHPELASLLADGLSGEAEREIAFRRADGSSERAYMGVRPVREGAFGLCLLLTDLTEQKHYEELRRTQAALRASEARYRALFESIDEGFCVIEVLFDESGQATDYVFLETNPMFERLTGLRDVIGKSMRALEPAHEEHWFRVYGEVARRGEPIRFENRAEALHRWYDVYAFPFGEAPDRRVAVLFNDITARKRAEDRLRKHTARFQALLDNAPLGVYLVDSALRIREINPVARSAFGEVREPIGRDFEEVARAIWPRRRAEEIVAQFRHTLETGEPHVVPEWIEERGDGGPPEYHEWQINRIPLPESGDGVVCYFRDISTHVHARQALHASEQALKEADRRKDQFLATLAHELRNPLAPIRNAVEVLKLKSPPEPELQWAHGVIDRQVQLMARLVDDLLDVSRISRNQLELRPGPVELAAVIESALETSQPVIEAGGHEVTVSLPPEPIRLEADAVRLAQAFANLLNNAAKFTKKGGHIWLTATQHENEASVSVRDNGIGITAEMLPHIFGIFSQEKSARERSHDGLGIGLSLVKGLVELHGGSVEARSAGPGRGSEFIVRVPALPAAPAEALQDRSGEVGRRPDAPYRVLVVDDNRDSADSLTLLLKTSGHEVGTAYDGEQALAVAEQMQPDVVLLDVGMPRLDGYETCRRIRERPWGPKVFLIAVTGWGEEADRRRTEAAGFDYHMVKPVDPGLLKELLASLPVSRTLKPAP